MSINPTVKKDKGMLKINGQMLFLAVTQSNGYLARNVNLWIGLGCLYLAWHVVLLMSKMLHMFNWLLDSCPPKPGDFPYVYFSKFLHVCIFGYLTIQVDCFMRSWFSRCAYVCQTVNVCVPEACRLDHFHIILFVGLTICSPPRQSGAVRFLKRVPPFLLLLLLLTPHLHSSPSWINPSTSPENSPWKTPTSIASFCCIHQKLSLQNSLFQTPTSIASYFYWLLLPYPPKALPPAQPYPDPYFYDLLLL